MTKREKQRSWVTDRDRTRIATRFPILVETANYEKRDGGVFWIAKNSNGSVSLKSRIVERFKPEAEVENLGKVQAFGVMARLEGIVDSGKEEVELPIAGEVFRDLVEGLLPDPVVTEIRKTESTDSNWARAFLAMAATASLDSARLVIWLPRTGTPGPAIFCSSKEVAAYVSLALSRLITGLRACLQCGTLFMPGRLDQSYCKRRCADLHRKRRQALPENSGGKQ